MEKKHIHRISAFFIILVLFIVLRQSVSFFIENDTQSDITIDSTTIYSTENGNGLIIKSYIDYFESETYPNATINVTLYDGDFLSDFSEPSLEEDKGRVSYSFSFYYTESTTHYEDIQYLIDHSIDSVHVFVEIGEFVFDGNVTLEYQ